MADTILYSYAAICINCKKCYLSIKDGGAITCPKCHAIRFFARLPHRILVSREGRKAVSQVTERVAGSNVFNEQLPLKYTFEDMTKLLSEKRLD